MTIREALDSYYLGLRARDMSAQTIDRYTRVLERFARWLEAQDVRDMAQLRVDHARKFTLERQAKVSAVTAHYEVTPVKAFTNWLAIEDMIDRDPLRNFRKPKLARTEVKIPNAAGVKRLLGMFDRNDPEGFRDLVIVRLIASTGIRRSEALGALLSDLDIPEGTLLIHGKGRKDRRVRLNQELALSLHRYVTKLRGRHKPKVDNLFISRKGGPMDGSAFGRRFAEYVRLANLPGRVTLHTLRHWCASSMLSNGAPLELVSRQLGHSNSTITSAVYAHVSQADVHSMHSVYDPLKRIGA